MRHKPFHIAVVGGGGHVGLPLSLLLAKKGFRVTAIDIDKKKVRLLRKKVFPFLEKGGPELLKKISSKSLTFETDYHAIRSCGMVLLTVGTPVDVHLNPDLVPVYQTIHQIKPYLRDGQVLVLRSTLFPGTSEKIHALLQAAGLKVSVAFCPERIAQGNALEELQTMPQIISGSDELGLETARKVFSAITPDIVELGMTEAEVAKLFSNSWRYIKFAVSNQFYMLCEERGLDFYRIREAMTLKYKRAADFPSAGFAAGPCLFKDTMQLAAYNRQDFQLGHSAMLINETLPDFLVERAKLAHPIVGSTVGILGMAFKADNDDKRESLAYKLKRLLVQEGATVLCSDPFIAEPSFVSVETIFKKCSVVFIGCPHSAYHKINFPPKLPVIDCWGLPNSGA